MLLLYWFILYFWIGHFRKGDLQVKTAEYVEGLLNDHHHHLNIILAGESFGPEELGSIEPQAMTDFHLTAPSPSC